MERAVVGGVWMGGDPAAADFGDEIAILHAFDDANDACAAEALVGAGHDVDGPAVMGLG